MTLTPELAGWRKAQRQILLARRLKTSPQDHARWSTLIEAQLRAALPFGRSWVVGLCWPFQAEFDARPAAEYFRSLGAQLALPWVVAKGQPLKFLEWWSGAPMRTGLYDLPIPDTTVRLRPDVLLVPPVGVGDRGDRLGYGGGFFDRSLAALDPRPITVAHAFELSRIPTTYPQPHDILMDFVVTEAGIQAAVPSGLKTVSIEECRRLVDELAAARGLPLKLL
jgi:5,10-methenyltetrahydrofolate synthetase